MNEDPKDNPIYQLPPDDTGLTADDVRAIVAGMLLNYTSPTKVASGYIQSQNFVSGSSGWMLSPTTAELNVPLSVTSINIPDQTTASSFHVDVNGNTWWGSNVATGYAGSNAYILSTGGAVFKNVQIGGTTIQYVITNSGIFSFGDGSDGTATCDGSTAVVGMSRSGNDYTLTRDVYFDSLTVNDSCTINTAGYRIFVKNTLTIGQGVSGKIFRNGTAGVGGGAGGLTSPFGGPGDQGGSTLADGYLKGAVAPGFGGGTTNNSGAPHSGGTGASTTNSLGTNGVGSAGSGGSGVNSIGGSSAGAGGGSGGTATASNVKLIANWHLATLLDIGSTGTTIKFDNSGGAAGGGAGGVGQNNNGGQTITGGGGGSGGGAGGIVAIYARNIVMLAGSLITANGGNGGAGGHGFDGNGGAGAGGGGGGGGGSGGNGGIIILCYNNLTNAGSITVTGGAAGAGGTPGVGIAFSGTGGTAGTAGSSGTTYQFQLSL